MSVLGQFAGTANLYVCNIPKQHVARHGTVSCGPSGSRFAMLTSSALHQQHTQLPQQLRRQSKAQNAKRSHITCVQAASAAQQQFPNRLTGSGARGALPSMSLHAMSLLHLAVHQVIPASAGFVNWVNTSKPPKYLWRTLAALLMGGQALVRILQGGPYASSPSTLI